MENNQYLQYLINEEIYVIEEPEASEYVAEPSPIPTVEEPKAELQVMGNKASNIYIINYDEKNEFIDTAQQSLLENILKAVNLDFNNIAVVNQAQNSLSFEELMKHVKADKVLVFGLPSSTEKYVLTVVNGYQLLQADDLASIGNDKALKKALWTCLQTLFLE